jgi:glycerophosphoryl diester phosphodiesterase
MPRAYSSADVDLIIERFHPPIIHVDERFFTPDIASIIRGDGGRVWINALGCPDVLGFLGMAEAGYGALLRDGANVLQTDRAGAMVAYLEKEGLHP